MSPNSCSIFKESYWAPSPILPTPHLPPLTMFSIVHFPFIVEESESQGGFDVSKVLLVHPSVYINKIAAVDLNIGLEQSRTLC